jgi:hypothetical protein
MKKIFLLITLFSFYTSFAEGDITLDGIYQGKNLYIMNPFSSTGVGFCVYEVNVNGKVTTDEINSSAFEVDLTLFDFKLGDKVAIIIKHKSNCAPKVLNPEVLKPKSTFKISLINIDDNNTLNWSTTNEAGELPFVVEQYRWNKWITVGTVQGKGTPNSNSYKMAVFPHSGNNKFRVKQIDYTRKPHYSEEVLYRSNKPAVTFMPKKPITEITFSRETMYEIYDGFGNIVKKGAGMTVDIKSLKSGDYYLQFDNEMSEFKKK